ncbi:flagellar protein FlaG [Halalkalibacillus halophilus]|uniref:flagellar protein FlaG n=1 Tax=Halalkalibacillus halophilus TaxID=392827 RepID=UPI000488DDE2|nr:flagellar protein FlaG [Halalkalibacillus halophilus]
MNITSVLSNSQLLQRSESSEVTTSKQDETKPKLQAVQDETGQINQSNELSKEQAMNLVEEINVVLEPANTSVKFEFHEKLERYYISVIDRDSEEIVKEIPPEKLLDVHAAMAEYMGFIVDEKI